MIQPTCGLELKPGQVMAKRTRSTKTCAPAMCFWYYPAVAGETNHMEGPILDEANFHGPLSGGPKSVVDELPDAGLVISAGTRGD